MDNVIIKISPARRHFKKRIGQVNHFLITTLVGLDIVKKGGCSLPEEFKTSWNPQNVERSADRSVRFILDASLSWVVDNLDSYFVEAARKPSIIEDEDLLNDYNGTGRSVNKRFELFYNKAKEENKNIDKYAALVEVAIQWRNNTVHFGADNILKPEYKSILQQNKEFYHTEFRHLDIDEMLASFDAKDGHPTFKEVASMINAIHSFVECVDVFLLDRLNVERFKHDFIEKQCLVSKYARQKINNLTDKRKEKYCKTLFRQYGFDLDE